MLKRVQHDLPPCLFYPGMAGTCFEEKFRHTQEFDSEVLARTTRNMYWGVAPTRLQPFAGPCQYRNMG